MASRNRQWDFRCNLCEFSGFLTLTDLLNHENREHFNSSLNLLGDRVSKLRVSDANDDDDKECDQDWRSTHALPKRVKKPGDNRAAAPAKELIYDELITVNGKNYIRAGDVLIEIKFDINAQSAQFATPRPGPAKKRRSKAEKPSCKKVSTSKKIRCPYRCGKQDRTLNAIKMHVMCWHDFHCPHCEFVGENGREMLEHFLKNHQLMLKPATSVLFVCQNCGMSTMNVREHWHHRIDKHRIKLELYMRNDITNPDFSDGEDGADLNRKPWSREDGRQCDPRRLSVSMFGPSSTKVPPTPVKSDDSDDDEEDEETEIKSTQKVFNGRSGARMGRRRRCKTSSEKITNPEPDRKTSPVTNPENRRTAPNISTPQQNDFAKPSTSAFDSARRRSTRRTSSVPARIGTTTPTARLGPAPGGSKETNHGSYDCPVQTCPLVFQNIVALKSHVTKAHRFWANGTANPASAAKATTNTKNFPPASKENVNSRARSTSKSRGNNPSRKPLADTVIDDNPSHKYICPEGDCGHSFPDIAGMKKHFVTFHMPQKKNALI